jgi:hypothetical protein
MSKITIKTDEKLDRATMSMMRVVMRSSLIYGEPFTEWINNNMDNLYEQFKADVDRQLKKENKV